MRLLLLALAALLLSGPSAVPMHANVVASPSAQESRAHAATFSGTVVKMGEKYMLSDYAAKLSYALDDPDKASMFEGKKVVVTGSLDVASNTIHVETILEVA